MSKCCCKCKNVGSKDKAFRIFAGFLIMAYGIYFNNAMLVGISFIPLLTGLFNFCPIYAMLNCSTSGITNENEGCCLNEDNKNNNDANNNPQNQSEAQNKDNDQNRAA